MAKIKYGYVIQSTLFKDYFKSFSEPKNYSMWTYNLKNAMIFDNEIDAESIIGEIDGILHIVKIKV